MTREAQKQIEALEEEVAFIDRMLRLSANGSPIAEEDREKVCRILLEEGLSKNEIARLLNVTPSDITK